MPCILAIETSAHIGAVSILRGEKCEEVLASQLADNDQKLSAWVLPAIERVLADAGLSPMAIDAVAFGAGPGSFTGVRTASATAQSLAYAWKCALVAVDSLEALAETSSAISICVVLDARMHELFSASFVRQADGTLQRLTATMVSAPSAVVVAAGAELIGSGVHLLPAPHVATPAATKHAEAHWAHGIAHIAARKLALGETTDPMRAEPIYVRNKVALTEAERKHAREAVA